jgi:hypothetical protein
MRVCLAVAAMLLATSSTWTAEKGTLTLVCNGTYETVSSGGPHGPFSSEPQPVTSLGVVVNFSEHEVNSVEFDAPIQEIDGASVSFKDLPNMVWGHVDRVTGELYAFKQIALPSGETTNYTYRLHCKPAKRML